MIEYKVGQQIVISLNAGSLYPIKPYKIETITKVIATQITTLDGRRYMIRSRRQVGNPWNGYQIAFNYFGNYGPTTVEEALKANQEWEEENRINNMRRELGDVRWKHVPAEIVEQIYNLLLKKENKSED